MKLLTTPQTGKTVFYIVVTGIAPRKRKAQRFEERQENEFPIAQAHNLAARLNLRHASAYAIPYNVTESEFTDSHGEKQTMVMRSIFPVGPAEFLFGEAK